MRQVRMKRDDGYTSDWMEGSAMSSMCEGMQEGRRRRWVKLK